MKLYTINSGRITLDGHSIDDFEPLQWRQLIGYVDQDYFFFYGTILENLVVGLKDYSLDDVDRVLKLTHAHHFVYEFPEGLNTSIGDKGNLLSGGQKARLALARTLLTQPKILILDEVTSALDNYTKEIIAESILTLRESMMIIIISHDDVMTDNADVIYRVEPGSISLVS